MHYSHRLEHEIIFILQEVSLFRLLTILHCVLAFVEGMYLLNTPWFLCDWEIFNEQNFFQRFNVVTLNETNKHCIYHAYCAQYENILLSKAMNWSNINGSSPLHPLHSNKPKTWRLNHVLNILKYNIIVLYTVPE